MGNIENWLDKNAIWLLRAVVLLSAFTFVLAGFEIKDSVNQIVNNSNLEKFREILKDMGGLLASFSAGIFAIVWWSIRKKTEEKGWAVFFFSTAMAAWGTAHTQWGVEPDWLHNSISTINDIFFLCGAYSLEYGKKFRIYKILRVNEENYIRRFFLFGIIVIVANVVLFLNNLDDWAWGISIFVSMLTLSLLVFAIGRSFWNRFSGNARIFIYVYIIVAGLFSLSAHVLYVITKLQGEDASDALIIYTDLLLSSYHILLTVLLGAVIFSWAYKKKLESTEREKKWEEQKKINADTVRQDMLHFIRNHLNFLQYDFKTLEEEALSKNNYQLAELYKENKIKLDVLRNLFDSLYALKHEEIQQGINLQELITKVVGTNGFIENSYTWRHFDSTIKINELSNVRATQALKLVKILTELCVNAFKHGDRWVKINILIKQYQIEIAVEDRGAGYKLEGIPQSSSGMKLIKTYLKDFNTNGEMNIELLYPGTKFSFNIPIKKLVYENSPT